MTIHTEHPFADPNDDVVRRLRARTGVSLWTAGRGADRAGLTVSSWLVAAGQTPRIVALLDPDADLTERLVGTGRCVLSLLQWRHHALADQFAGVAPAPGGLFAQSAFSDTDAGPRLDDAGSWAELRLEDTREVGWSLEATCLLERVHLGDEDDPLLHRRGRYRRVPDAWGDG